MTLEPPVDENTGRAQDAAPRSKPDTSLPQWVRVATHLVAVGWGTVEIALYWARLNSLSFIALVLLADHGPTALARLRNALAAT